MSKVDGVQILRFLTIGATAAVVHCSVVILLVQIFNYAPLIANVAGFIVSFQVSYWGHRRFTFSGTEVSHREAYPRLVVVQLFNFGLNESLYYLFLSFNLPYILALVIVLSIIPFFTFFTSKFWVFEG